MNTFAYCCASYRDAVGKAAGVRPMTCPPHSSKAFWLPTLLEGRDLLYFDLHGWRGESSWYGDNSLPALRAEQIREADLGGCVVFAANCYLGDDDSPMLDALLDAGASWVVGGRGPNFEGTGRRLVGANLLGMWFRWLLSAGMSVPHALRAAKGRLLASRWVWTKANADARQFKAYYRGIRQAA